MSKIWQGVRSGRWRRVALIVLVLIVAYRTYGDSLIGWFQGPDPVEDLVVTSSEFRADLGDGRPAWFIGLRNQSSNTSFDDIVLEATYYDASGQVLETDRIVIHELLGPGQERQVGSPDPEPRPGAVAGTLEIAGARVRTP